MELEYSSLEDQLKEFGKLSRQVEMVSKICYEVVLKRRNTYAASLTRVLNIRKKVLSNCMGQMSKVPYDSDEYKWVAWSMYSFIGFMEIEKALEGISGGIVATWV